MAEPSPLSLWPKWQAHDRGGLKIHSCAAVLVAKPYRRQRYNTILQYFSTLWVYQICWSTVDVALRRLTGMTPVSTTVSVSEQEIAVLSPVKLPPPNLGAVEEKNAAR